MNFYKDYYNANLVDETMSIPVIIRNSALSKEELSEPRIHYLKYYKNDDIWVVLCECSRGIIASKPFL